MSDCKLTREQLHTACTTGHHFHPGRRGEARPRSSMSGVLSKSTGHSKWHRRMVAAGMRPVRPEKPGSPMLTLYLPRPSRARIEPTPRAISVIRANRKLLRRMLLKKLHSERVLASLPARRRPSKKRVKPKRRAALAV
jgi:hypothetical protein